MAAILEEVKETVNTHTPDTIYPHAFVNHLNTNQSCFKRGTLLLLYICLYFATDFVVYRRWTSRVYPHMCWAHDLYGCMCHEFNLFTQWLFIYEALFAGTGSQCGRTPGYERPNRKIAKAKHEIEMEFKASEGGKNYIAGKKLKYNWKQQRKKSDWQHDQSSDRVCPCVYGHIHTRLLPPTHLFSPWQLGCCGEQRSYWPRAL